MQNAVSSDRIHQVVLETIKEMSNNGKNSLAPENAMEVAVRKISPTSMQHDMDLRNSVLAYWNELLRCGHLGFGICDAPKNWEAGPCFVTEVGRKGLEHADRDPSNPTGYLSYLDREASSDSVTRGYVEESLNAYRAGCYNAAAVLIGAAAERLVLILRDELSARLKSGGKIPKG